MLGDAFDTALDYLVGLRSLGLNDTMVFGDYTLALAPLRGSGRRVGVTGERLHRTRERPRARFGRHEAMV